jgi:hypothetical protein
MTAIAMIIGMVPMALGLGEGGEQNAPLGRAVIGGLCCDGCHLFFVPTLLQRFAGTNLTAGKSHRACSKTDLLEEKNVTGYLKQTEPWKTARRYQEKQQERDEFSFLLAAHCLLRSPLWGSFPGPSNKGLEQRSNELLRSS